MTPEQITEWRVIPKSQNLYEVSNTGLVRSWYCRSKKPRILKPMCPKRGYAMVKILQYGKFVTKRVHRLVAESFIPNPDKLKTVNHKDGDKLNNHVDNLEWASYQANIVHSYEYGLRENRARGERMNSALLTDDKALAIRSEYAKGNVSQRALAAKYGVTQHCIYKVVNNITWTHLEKTHAS